MFESVYLRDVWMIEGGEDFGFALEPFQTVGIVRHRGGQDLRRDCPLQVRVGRTVHLAHATDANLSVDAVRANASAGSQDHANRMTLYEHDRAAHEFHVGQREYVGMTAVNLESDAKTDATDPQSGPRERCRVGAATTVTISLVLIVIVMTAYSFSLPVTPLFNWPQEPIERLRCNLSPLLARRGVREAEMNPHVDSSVDYVVGQI